LAKERNWHVDAVYKDIHTGTELFERPQLTLLREAMRAGACDVLVVHALDRLSRKQTHLGLILSEAEHAGVEWISVTEDIDNSPQGQILRAVIGGMAEMERLKLAERTMRGRVARAKAGKLHPGRTPIYGYRWKDESKGSFVIDPVTGPIVQRIFRDLILGKTIRSIACELSAEGIPTSSGSNTWSSSTIHTMLKKEIYTGEATAWRYGREKKSGGGFRTYVRPIEEQIKLPDGTVPRLIEPEEFDAVQLRLAHNQAMAARSNSDPEASLLRGGLVRCGYCGTTATVYKSKGLTYYRHSMRAKDKYQCPSVLIRLDHLDSAVWARVTSIVQNPDVIAAEIERLTLEDPGESDLKLLARRLDEIQRRHGNLVRRLSQIDDDTVAEMILAEMKTLNVQKEQLESERSDLEQVRAAWSAKQHDLDDLRQWCDRVAGNLQDFDYARKRQLLEALDVRIKLFDSEHQPRFEIAASVPLGSQIVSNTSSACAASACSSATGPVCPASPCRSTGPPSAASAGHRWCRPPCSARPGSACGCRRNSSYPARCLH
jgi:site-specific DNA recombinase